MASGCVNSHNMLRFFILFIMLAGSLFKAPAQNSAIGVDEAGKDIGTVDQVYKISAGYVLQNNLARNLYLLRADAAHGITIRSSKKTLKPNDTALITVEFIPERTGRFSEPVSLVTSADGKPYQLTLSGNIKSIKTDDKTACFYFKKPNNAGVKTTEPLVVTEPTKPRDVSNKMPDAGVSHQPVKKDTVKSPPQPRVQKDDKLLDDNLYKPNNIVFVVDVSSSMKDSTKLPVMQASLYHLIEALRPTDHVTFVTYADSVKLVRENLSGADKTELNSIVSRLKARGLTKGNKAILFGLDVALMNYVEGGNNQIILATDGKFRFYPDDQQKFKAKQGDKKVILSTVAFGNDKDAMDNLKDIAKIGNGSFIHVKSRARAQEVLLDEIKDKSLVR